MKKQSLYNTIPSVATFAVEFRDQMTTVKLMRARYGRRPRRVLHRTDAILRCVPVEVLIRGILVRPQMMCGDLFLRVRPLTEPILGVSAAPFGLEEEREGGDEKDECCAYASADSCFGSGAET